MIVSTVAFIIQSLSVRVNNTVVQGLCENGPITVFQFYLTSMQTRGIYVEAATFNCLSIVCEKRDMYT